MTTISVAMATYNGARFLAEQLDSIAAQTLLPAELVITDDASTDDTAVIAQAFAAQAPFPVHIHRNPTRLGYKANFMRATGLCTGELIALCDQDDRWAPAKLAQASAPFAEPEVLLSFHEAWLIDERGERGALARIFPAPVRTPPLGFYPFENPYGFTMMFRRRLLDFADLWERSVDCLADQGRMAHDQWYFFLATTFGTVAFIDEPLADYRQHGANTYGLERAPRTMRERMIRWIAVGSRQFAGFAVAAEARAAILTAASARLAPGWRDRAAQAIGRLHRVARHCAWRASAYERGNILGRLGAWSSLVADRAYSGHTRWTFGRKAAVKDLLLLLPPRLLVRPGQPRV